MNNLWNKYNLVKTGILTDSVTGAYVPFPDYKPIPDYVIYGGVEIPKRISSPDNLESAVFIGRLDEHTGVLEYVKSVENIKKYYPKFKFIIVVFYSF